MYLARIRIGSLAFLTALVVVAALSAPAGATPSKPFSLVICAPGQTCDVNNPPVVAPGSAFGTTPTAASMTATLTNENKLGSGITLGSANLDAPAGFAVTAVTPLPLCATPLPQNGPACVYLAGNEVQFRDLNLAPGGVQSVTMSVVTPQPSTSSCTTTSPCSWSIHAKQSNAFNGTGNDLNLNAQDSALGTVTSAVAGCNAGKPCSTSLGDRSGGKPASITTTVTASSGKTSATIIESLNYGQPYACPNFPEQGHESGFWNVTGGTDRTKTISDTTTVFTGYAQEECLLAPWQFTQKVPTSTGITLVPASVYGDGTSGPDGSPGTWYIGLLPDCGNAPSIQVKPNKQPCVDRSQSTNNGIVSTTVFSVPAGEPGDPTHYN